MKCRLFLTVYDTYTVKSRVWNYVALFIRHTLGLRSKKLWYLNLSSSTSFSLTSCSIRDLEESNHLWSINVFKKSTFRSCVYFIRSHALQVQLISPLVDFGLIQKGLGFVQFDQDIWWGNWLADSEDAGIALRQRAVPKPSGGGGQWAAISGVISGGHSLAVQAGTGVDAP